MKTLLILSALAATGGGLWLRDHNQREAQAAGERAELLRAEVQLIEIQARRAPAEDRRWTLTQTGWVNHQAGVSPMQSVGLGGGYAGMPRPKKVPTAAEQTRARWGWQGGTALDR